MSRRKPTVVSPQPTTSVLRRSARLVSLQNRDGQEKDLVFRSEPPRKIRRELGTQLPSKRLVFEEGSPEMNSSIDGFSSRRRSLRVSIRGFSDSSKSGNSGLSRCSKEPISSERGKSGGDSVKSRDRSRSTSRPKTKHMFTDCADEEEEVSVRLSERKRTRIAKLNKEENAVPKAVDGKRIGKEEEKRLKTKNKLEKGCTEESASSSLRRSPRFSSGGGKSVDCQCSTDVRKSGNTVLRICSKKSISSERGKDGVKSRDRSRSTSRPRPKTKQMFRGCDDDEKEKEVSVRLSERKGTRIAKPDQDENAVGGKRIGKGEEEKRLKTKNKLEKGCTEELESASCTLRRSPRFSSGGGSVDASSQGRKPSNIVLNKCSTKSLKGNGGGDGVKSRDRSRSRLRPKTKQMYRECDEEEVSEGKNKRIAKENEQKAVPKPEEGKIIGQKEEGLKTKNKLAEGWTEELELALQGAYLTVKPSPNFWKKVSKMVPGKSAQECFDRVNSDLITPRQPQPRSRASRSKLSPIPQFSLSASKLLKPNSPKTKIRHRSNKLSKKTIRHLLEKQNHMDQGLGFDLFSVFEPGTTSNLLSTPVEKGQRLPRILETPLPCSRFASKDKTTLVSPPVLKQVKNKALHERYIDHLHIREAKRKAESTRLARKENIRPVDDNQKKDSVRAVKDTLLWNVQDAIQKLKGLEAANSSSSSDSCYARGETDEEDESI